MPRLHDPSPLAPGSPARLCPECGSPMLIQSLEWDGETQQQIYRCPECGHEEVVTKAVNE